LLLHVESADDRATVTHAGSLIRLCSPKPTKLKDIPGSTTAGTAFVGVHALGRPGFSLPVCVWTEGPVAGMETFVITL
jgi:hypothetical protein